MLKRHALLRDGLVGRSRRGLPVAAGTLSYLSGVEACLAVAVDDDGVGNDADEEQEAVKQQVLAASVGGKTSRGRNR